MFRKNSKCECGYKLLMLNSKPNLTIDFILARFLFLKFMLTITDNLTCHAWFAVHLGIIPFSYSAEPNIFLQVAPIPRPCPSAATYAHPCYSNCAHVFKKCVMCIYPPTPSLGLGWRRHTQGWTHLNGWRWFGALTLESIEWELIQWPLPICFAIAHAHPWTIISNPCPPMNNNIAAMPTHAYPLTILLHPCPPKTHVYMYLVNIRTLWASLSPPTLNNLHKQKIFLIKRDSKWLYRLDGKHAFYILQ